MVAASRGPACVSALDNPSLLAVSRVPVLPARDGLALRASNLLRELAHRWRITLIAPLAIGSAAEVEALGMARVVPMSAFTGWSGPLVARDRLTISAAIGDVVRQTAPRCALVWAGAESVVDSPDFPPTVFDNLDCGALRSWRELRYAVGVRARLRIVRDTLGIAAEERRIVRACMSTVVNSDSDARMLRRLSGCETVHVVPNGVAPQSPAGPAEEAPEPTVIFTGAMDYPPNVVAVGWFVRSVWPAVRKALPTARFVVAGRDVNAEVLSLASVPGVEIVGEVPSMSAVLRTAWLAVAPMRTGTGLRSKVLDAWAVARPVVLSPIAASGLRLDADALGLVARDAGQTLRVVVRLLSEPSERRRLGAAAHSLAAREYQWPMAAARLAELLRAAMPS